MLRSVSAIVKASGYVVLVAAIVTYATVTRITLYRNTTEIALLRARLDAEVIARTVKDDGFNERMTAMEKTVYVAPNPTEVPTPTARRPAAVEQWMVNADSELRKRILALEQWRLKHEDR